MANVECGMGNGEYSPREAAGDILAFFIPHSAFPIPR